MRKSEVSFTDFPESPGIYEFVDTHNTVLYVGRATSLRSRLRSYFAPDLVLERGPHFERMVLDATHIRITQTESVLAAILLESQKIKELQPYYNTREKDDRSFCYVVITEEEFPRVLIERERSIIEGGLSYEIRSLFGPFPSSPTIREVLRLLRRLFPFRDSRARTAKGNFHHDRFYAMLGLSPSSESSEVARTYNKSIGYLEELFSGSVDSLSKKIEKEMNQAAKAQKFEEAMKLRDTLYALNHLNDMTLVKHEITSAVHAGVRVERIEAYDISHTSGLFTYGVMTVLERGEIAKSAYRSFRIKSFSGINDIRSLVETVTRRLKHTEWPLPEYMVVDGGKAQLDAITEVVRRNGFQDRVKVVSVVKDERHAAKDILGIEGIADKKLRANIILANSESHRYAIGVHRRKRDKIS